MKTGSEHPNPELDRLVHEPARLAILTNLYLVESADATWLLQQTGLTWGNLASHLGKLEEAGYVRVKKSFKGRKPQTTLSIAEAGREALLAYRRQMLDALQPLE
ncbi:MAG: transcriptional regulator [Coriobacteriia bacterium]|nr:transcriptional regulator [Coriobacteriia bacterium]